MVGLVNIIILFSQKQQLETNMARLRGGFEDGLAVRYFAPI